MSERANLSLRVLNVLGFVFTLVLNALANALPINGKTTGELSDLYPNLFVPAGLTFSIWGLIYLLLAVFVVFQLRDRGGTHVRRIGGWFLLSSIANGCWILAWHYEQVLLSVAIMFVLLASLLAIYVRLGIGLGSPGRAAKLCVHLPFSVYLGWISIATVANITALLVALEWGRFGLSEELWTLVALALAAVLALAMLLRRSDVPYALVVLWAFAGIALKRLTIDPEPRTAVLAALAVCAAAVAVLAAARVRAWLRT